jgi:putative spermidine/putrescine transport system permease protein
VSAKRVTRRFAEPTWLVVPVLFLLFIAFVVPVVMLLARSVLGPPVGLGSYQSFLGSPELRTVLLRTLWTAGIVTVISIGVGYPYAFLAVSTTPRMRRLLLGVVTTSLFISLVVRCYAWLAILDRGGALNALLHAIGFPNAQIVGVHNFAGVVIGILQYTIPLSILPMYDVMSRVDERLPHAAASLGAGPIRKFLTVYFPLTLPGVAAGALLTFISALGYYIAPSLLGGPQNTMIGSLIANDILTTLQWGQGAAVATVLLVLALLFFVSFNKIMARASR